MPVTVPTVEVYAGDTVDWPIYTLQNPDQSPRDLEGEGWTEWRAQWRVKEVSPVAIDLIVDASEANVGVLKIKASPEATASMNVPGVWDLQATKGDEIKTFLRGKTKYTKDVTRDA
jgi:hypothetical protein